MHKHFKGILLILKALGFFIFLEFWAYQFYSSLLDIIHLSLIKIAIASNIITTPTAINNIFNISLALILEDDVETLFTLCIVVEFVLVVLFDEVLDSELELDDVAELEADDVVPAGDEFPTELVSDVFPVEFDNADC